MISKLKDGQYVVVSRHMLQYKKNGTMYPFSKSDLTSTNIDLFIDRMNTTGNVVSYDVKNDCVIDPVIVSDSAFAYSSESDYESVQWMIIDFIKRNSPEIISGHIKDGQIMLFS